MRHATIFVAALVGGLLVAGCDREGPMERAGKQIDEAASQAGKKIEDATEQAGQNLEKAGESLREQAER